MAAWCPFGLSPTPYYEHAQTLNVRRAAAVKWRKVRVTLACLRDYGRLWWVCQFLVGSYPPGISKTTREFWGGNARILQSHCKVCSDKDIHPWAGTNVRKQVPRGREEISRILESCHASLEGRSIIKTNL